MPFDRSFKYHLLQVAKREAKFSQAKGLNEMEDTSLSGQVSGGYCFGASMCWLKVTMTKEAVNYGGVIDQKKKAVVQSMARGHVIHERVQDRAASNLRDAALLQTENLYNRIEERRQAEFDEAFADAKAELEKASQTYCDNYSTFADRAELKDKMKEVVAILEATLAAEKKQIEKKQRQAELVAQNRADQRRSLVSPNVTTKDDVVQETWRLLATVEERKYTGALTPVKRIAPGGSTVGDFVLDVVGAPSFTVGRGMIISFETGKAPTTEASVLSPPGHAIALYRVDANKYWLFEPNLGVFVVEGRVKLIYALVLIMADGYDKRILGDDRAIVFCKTSKTFPDQGGDAVDNGAMVDRDKAKNKMKKGLEQLAADAFEAGLNTLKVKKNKDEQLIASANKAMQDAFLRARIASAATKPSELLDEGSAGNAFLKSRGEIGKTGLFKLYESLDTIY